MPRRAARTDLNQQQVTERLRECGLDVALSHTVGNGFPDMIIGAAGLNYMVELKSNRNVSLTNDEEKFANEWKGQIATHYSSLDIIAGFLTYAYMLDNKEATLKILAAFAMYITKYHDESVEND